MLATVIGTAVMSGLVPSGRLVPGIKWANLYYGPDQIALAADLNGDGFGDVIYISRQGQSPVTTAISQQGMKSLLPAQVISAWGSGLNDACAMEVDVRPGADLIGLFEGKTLKLASAFRNNQFQLDNAWLTLPKTLTKPHLAHFDSTLLAWDETSGAGYRVDVKTKAVTPLQITPGVTKLRPIGTSRGSWVFGLSSGEVKMGFALEKPPTVALGMGIQFVVLGGEVYVEQVSPRAPSFVRGLPGRGSTWDVVDMDHDGDLDLLEFRLAAPANQGQEVTLHRFVTNGELDSDHDGLTDVEERLLGTDPFNPDTDGDGLLDEWEVKGFRGLDLKGIGCDPKKFDLVCLVARFSNTIKEMVERQMKNIQGYYTSLGWALHPVWLDPLGDEDQKKPWWANRDKFLPNKWRGVAHFMQISPWGGGQADQMGDGGGCGGNEWSFYATFIHEFGHQLGLPHEGFYAAAWCPTYSSMMNYAYSYTFEGDIKKIHYSDGRLKDFIIRETDLDETLPLPYDKVKFLESPPYRYRLKPEGDKTLIDWNWNGVFGEKHVRADVNYSYSTTAGRRDEVGRTQSAPFTVVHNEFAYVLYAQHAQRPTPPSDPSVSQEKPGWIMARRLIEPYKWSKEQKIVAEGCTGDPVAVSFGGRIVVAYPSKNGIEVRWFRVRGDAFSLEHQETVAGDRTPTLGVYSGKLILWGWNPTSKSVEYAWLGADFKPTSWQTLTSAGSPVSAATPVGMTVDTALNQLIVGFGENQDKDRPSRWQIRRYSLKAESLTPVTSTPSVPHSEREWVEGEKGGARGTGRPILLYDAEGRTGMKGRVLYFGLGLVGKDNPWSCVYVGQTIGDKNYNGGWMVKRYYDEWTQSRSAPGVAWFGGDLIYAYRWVDASQNDRDNILHVAYRGTGIEDVPMGDFDDITFIRTYGAKHSILYLRE